MTLRGNYAWDVLEIGSEVDLLKTGVDQQGLNVSGLPTADFEGEEAAGSQHGEGGGDQTAIDFKAIAAGKEGDGRLVVANFDGQ